MALPVREQQVVGVGDAAVEIRHQGKGKLILGGVRNVAVQAITGHPDDQQVRAVVPTRRPNSLQFCGTGRDEIRRFEHQHDCSVLAHLREQFQHLYVSADDCRSDEIRRLLTGLYHMFS
ncbi:MAG: hypothetical protein J07HX64_00995 [halophilic archaeon J07HX64]|nr:MAG: hypothetical protein J07HX64_00995 [halophilic archaeon J07HX64]